MPHVNNTIIDVLMAVAKSEFTSLMPILANIAVNEVVFQKVCLEEILKKDQPKF